MFKKSLFLTLMVLMNLASVSVKAGIEDEVNTILKKADKFRLSSERVLVETNVKTIIDGSLDKERVYSVYIAPHRKSVVLSKSPAEKGQKFLMMGDDFWIMVPGSYRPMRITPVQKLLGDASAGDIASLSWADDYKGVGKKETTIDKIAGIEIEMTAARSGVTYKKIILTLRKSDYLPIKARLFVSEDKEAKVANFKSETNSQGTLVSEMEIQDLVQTNRKTVIKYVHREPKSINDRFYNPSVLVKEDPE